jgi:isoleucyl-tRNA synthetase
VRRSRDRFKEAGPDREAAAVTLYEVLMMLAKLLAPFTPFLSDALYRELGGARDSVHLESWPEAAAGTAEDAAVIKEMELVRKLASLALEKRAEANIPVRQALALLSVTSPSFRPALAEILADEVNVKSVEQEVAEKIEVFLNTEITPELRREGAIREMIRQVNSLRKESGLTRADKIAILLEGESELVKSALVAHQADLLAGTIATEVIMGAAGDAATELEFEDGTVRIGIRKV